MLSVEAGIDEVKRVLESWLDNGRLIKQMKVAFKGKKAGADLVVQFGKHLILAIEYRGSSNAASIGIGIARARQSAQDLLAHGSVPVVPVVAVPYMGEVGRRLCEEAGVSWVDLSGNADISAAPMLLIRIEGKPNRFIRRGRPSTAFGARSGRVARLLLLEPSRSFRQQELANESGLDDGFVSRIVHRLESDGLVARGKDGRLRVSNRDLLLDAWREAYDFTKHTIIKGHSTARTSEELMSRTAKVLASAKMQHAATGLAAAWLYTGFAGFRLVTFYTAKAPDDALCREMGFREEAKGANVWLVVPNDQGVFVGATKKGGVICAHPLQVYLDLQAHPERAKEAATELRDRLFDEGE